MIPIKSNMQWYCLKSQTRREHVAARMLERRLGLEVCMPRIAQRRKTVRGSVRCIEPLFPGYVFARYEMDIMGNAVVSTQGISGIVNFSGKIIPVSESIILELQSLAPEGQIIEISEELRPGTEVEIAEDDFFGLKGIIKSYQPTKKRVKVLLDLLGRDTEVDLACSAVVLNNRLPNLI